MRADALSGGMKRRLQVALALLGSSRVILLGKALYMQAMHPLLPLIIACCSPALSLLFACSTSRTLHSLPAAETRSTDEVAPLLRVKKSCNSIPHWSQTSQHQVWIRPQEGLCGQFWPSTRRAVRCC